MKAKLHLSSIYIFVSLSICFCQQMNAQVSLQDSLAIVAIYQATDGPNWPNQTNWLSTDSALHTWYGVTTESGRITEIVLRGNELKGTLPADISSLTHLTTLDLRSNNLEGVLSLSGLVQLDTCVLSGNLLTDLPDLSSLTSLKALWLYGCAIDTLPSLANSLFLEELILMNNGARQIPDLSSNKALKKLFVSSNNLSEIPGLDSLVNLEELFFYENCFTVLPEVNHLRKLKKLAFFKNEITVFPPIDSLKNLENLYCGRLPLEALPPLDSLKSLKVLDCQYTFITEIPGLANLHSLETLDCDGCRITHLNGLEHCTKLDNLSCGLNFLYELPSLTQTQLTQLRCGYNSFAFDDLEQFSSMNLSVYEIHPQRYFIIQADTVGANLVLSAPFGGVSNSYDWYDADSFLVNAPVLTLPLGSNMSDQYRCLVGNLDPFFTDLGLYSYAFDPCKRHLSCDLDGDGRCDLKDNYIVASHAGETGQTGSCSQLPNAWGDTLPDGRDVSEIDFDQDGIIETTDNQLIFRDTFFTLDVQESLTTFAGPALTTVNASITEVQPGTYELSATIVPLDTIENVTGICFGELICLPGEYKAIDGYHDLSASVFRDTVDNLLITMLFYFAGDVRLSTGLPSNMARLEVYYSTLNDTVMSLYPGDHLSTCIIKIEDIILRQGRTESPYEDTVEMVLQSYGSVFFEGGVSVPLRTHIDTSTYFLEVVLGEGANPDTLETASPVDIRSKLVAIYPNPLSRNNSRLTLNYFSKGEEKIRVTLFDLKGHINFQDVVRINPGENDTSILLPKLSAGVYLLRLSWPDGRQETKRLVMLP